MHAGGSGTDALHEQPEVLAVQRRSVILGVVELRERLSDRRLPERELAIMLTGGYIDDNLEQPTEVRHGVNLRRSTPAELPGLPTRQPASPGSQATLLSRYAASLGLRAGSAFSRYPC
jgi:hypothetical protein